MKTATVIKQMMLEPCGKSLFDSGGVYGYQYEHRAERNLEKEPYAAVEWYIQEDGRLCGSVTKSMYHHLCETLEYDSYLTSRLKNYFRREEKCAPYVNTDAWEYFARSLKGSSEVFSDNTYNHDSTLDGVFVYTAFTMPDDMYVILATHNGCDVRGGYSTPKVFRQVDEYRLFDFNNIWCYCASGCSDCSDINSDCGTCIYLEPEEWSEEDEPDKYWLKDGKLYCKDCRKEVFVT